MELRDWYRVLLNDTAIRLDVSPPGQAVWQAEILWADIIRVCFKAEGARQSDGWYMFTRHRPESYAVPVEADGGSLLLAAFLQRKLFSDELAIRAAIAEGGIFCWPPLGDGSSTQE